VNWLLFVFAALTWGGSYIAIRFMLEGIPPFASAGVRCVLAAFLMALIAVAGGRKFPKSKGILPKVAGLAFINFVIPWACLFWGEQYVQPAIASIMNSTTPLFVFLFSYWLLQDERPTWFRFVGVAVGFLGVLCVFGPAVSGVGNDPRSMYGTIAVTVVSTGYGLGAVLTKRLGGRIDIRWSISIQCLVASVVLLTMSALFEPKGWIGTVGDHPASLWSLLYLAMISTAVGWIIYFRLIREWGALRSSAVTYVMPFVSLALDWLWLGKLPSVAELLGGALILVSVGLIHVNRAPVVEG
jgi:drug/metabolite transporter (DMT)-like permease